MRKLLILFLIIPLNMYSQRTYELRGLVRMLYGGDSLTMSFSGDSVLFDANNGLYKFPGYLLIDSLRFHDGTTQSTAGGGGSSYTFTGGLNESPAGTVSLGGNFTTDKTVTLNTNTGIRWETNIYDEAAIFSNSGDDYAYVRAKSGPVNPNLYLISTTGSNYSSMVLNGSEIGFSILDVLAVNLTINANGLVYGSDCSGRWSSSDRYIPDIGWVRNEISDSIQAVGSVTIPTDAFINVFVESDTMFFSSQNTFEIIDMTSPSFENLLSKSSDYDTIYTNSHSGTYEISYNVYYEKENNTDTIEFVFSQTLGNINNSISDRSCIFLEEFPSSDRYCVLKARNVSSTGYIYIINLSFVVRRISEYIAPR